MVEGGRIEVEPVVGCSRKAVKRSWRAVERKLLLKMKGVERGKIEVGWR